jgi:predicted RNA-binding Zn-ribbon protein involved in translation (DUF1610 family)
VGDGYFRKCPKCGFEFKEQTGAGFLYPIEYEQTIQKAKNGELGKAIQTFLTEHEDGVLDAEYVTLCCEDCGNLSTGKDLTMYLPKNRKKENVEHSSWSIAFGFEGAEYVTKRDFKRYFQEYAKYSHRCEQCGGAMRIMGEDEEIMCPKCKLPLEITDVLMLD